MAEKTVRVWVEKNNSGGCMAFALEWPGAYAHAPTREETLNRLRVDLEWTNRWLLKHEEKRDYSPEAPLKFVQTVPANQQEPGDSEAFFDWDAQPCSDAEIDATHRYLQWSRSDLLELIIRLDNSALDHRIQPNWRTIRETIDHIAIAEWWYMTRILADPSTAPDWKTCGNDPFERLENVRRMFDDDFLPMVQSLSMTQRARQYTHRGETWSARKVLRRAVWHELYHLKQIGRMVGYTKKSAHERS